MVQGGDGNYQYAWKHIGHNDTFSATSTLIVPASVTKDTVTTAVAFILTVKNTVVNHTETVTKMVVITVKDNPATINP